ncbi:MAG: prephenate dehydratase [bacterium]|nr:prephenate dehydratase [bacterium]
MALNNIRKRIDHLDAKILRLLDERMEQAIMSRKFKTNIQDTGREAELLERLKQNARGLINPEFCVKLYTEIITESKRLQNQQYRVIGFQGEHGAFSEAAAKEWNSEIVPVPNRKFGDVFDGVAAGLYDFGIVPVENTLGGNVGQVNDLLFNTELYIIGAIDMPVHHSLMALPGTALEDVRDVYSHPQALAQCRNFLAENDLDGQPYYDTAGSAYMLMEERPKGAAAIAGAPAAELYGLEILKENIEDLPTNRTRFLILSKEKNTEEREQEGEKCSIHFSTLDKAGTLFQILEIFANSGINLTRIESIPTSPGEYTFFIDLIGRDTDQRVIDAIEQARTKTKNFRLMGCYGEIRQEQGGKLQR